MLYSFVLSAQIPLFTPPLNWQCAEPKNASDYVQVGFVGAGSTPFRPSVSLSTEEIDSSLKEYVKAVKELHLADPGTAWRDLGKFSMVAGTGRLVEISSSSPWGPVKILQAIFVLDGKMAYILTATALKKEFPLLQKEILQSLQSLSLQPSLVSALADASKKEKLEALFSDLGNVSEEEKKTQWEQVKKEILQGYPEMGSHWHFLALKEGYAKIHKK